MKRGVGLAIALALLVLFVVVPYISVGTHGVFRSDLDNPGTLQLLGLMFVFGAVALTYDLLFGYTGLLSFGHALYFALGVYTMAIATTEWDLSFAQALALTAGVGLVVPLVLGAVSLRVGGIAFAMVTLAFAEAFSVVVKSSPGGLTHGEEGVPVDYEALPSAFVGVLNTKNLYWLALGYLAVVVAIVYWAVDSSPGRYWQAIRENEQRVEVLGAQPFRYKLLVFVFAAFLATMGGVVYVLLIGTATPQVTTAAFTLTLLLMVVIGGAGTLWGAVVGGMLYTFFDYRLTDWSESEAVQALPSVLSTPLSQPLFVLGTLFILLVVFLPGGLAGLTGLRRRGSGLSALEEAVGLERTHGGLEEEAEPTL
jgi:branched-chain amino acid transport system permease protein